MRSRSVDRYETEESKVCGRPSIVASTLIVLGRSPHRMIIAGIDRARCGRYRQTRSPGFMVMC